MKTRTHPRSDSVEAPRASELIAFSLFVLGTAMVAAAHAYLSQHAILKAILESLGTSILTAAILKFFIDRYSNDSAEKQLLALNQQIDRLSKSNPATRQIAAASRSRKGIDYDPNEMIANAPHGATVRIMGISLVSLIGQENAELILTKAQEGVVFNILILKETSTFLAHRESEYPMKSGFQHEVSQFVGWWKGILALCPEEYRKNLLLRFYDMPPRMFLLQTNGRSCVQFYSYGFDEFEGPSFMIEPLKDRNSLSDQLTESFKFVWSTAVAL